MAPTSHLRSTPIQVLAPPTLPEVEGVLPEETMPIGRAMGSGAPATCTHNSPSVGSIGTSVPEQHPSVTTALKHFKSHKMPATTLVFRGFPIAPSVQAIIVDCVTVVDPQLTPVVGDDAKPVMACPEYSQAACPTHSKVITAAEARPFATRVTIVHNLIKGHAHR